MRPELEEDMESWLVGRRRAMLKKGPREPWGFWGLGSLVNETTGMVVTFSPAMHCLSKAGAGLVALTWLKSGCGFFLRQGQ